MCRRNFNSSCSLCVNGDVSGTVASCAFGSFEEEAEEAEEITVRRVRSAIISARLGTLGLSSVGSSSLSAIEGSMKGHISAASALVWMISIHSFQSSGPVRIIDVTVAEVAIAL